MTIGGQHVGEVTSLFGDEVDLVDSSSRWPAHVDVRIGNEVVPIALHIGRIGRTHRGRDNVERRFQNPGQGHPITSPQGRLPIVVGLWKEGDAPVLVGMDAVGRLGRTTRFSMFVPLELLHSAQTSGWAERDSASGERIAAFAPRMFPVYVDAVRRNVQLDSGTVTLALDAAGFADEPELAIERARRTVTALVRNAQFSARVRDAYGGLCAMCGLNYSLVAGAHIYPVAAKDSPDEIWNGLALCHNHHALFDAHRIYVDPRTKRIVLHEGIHRGTDKSAACASFVRETFVTLRMPPAPTVQPRISMFERRYTFFDSKYDWV